VAAGCEILVWGFAANGPVRSVVIVEMGEGIDVFIEPIEAMRKVWQA
jgi:hypothetical protein